MYVEISVYMCIENKREREKKSENHHRNLKNK